MKQAYGSLEQQVKRALSQKTDSELKQLIEGAMHYISVKRQRQEEVRNSDRSTERKQAALRRISRWLQQEHDMLALYYEECERRELTIINGDAA